MTQTVLGWCLVVAGPLAAVLGVLLLRQQHIAALLRKDAARREAELAHLVERRLPTTLPHRRAAGARDPGLRERELAGSRFAGRLDTVMSAFQRVTADAEQRAGEAAETAVRGLADRLLTLVYQQQDLVEATEHRHHAPEVLRDLYPIDHTSQHLARRLFSLRLLTGSGPGRQRPTTGLHELLRGAIGTAPGYDRVRILDRPQVSVRTQAVEPLIQLFGHLVENAVLVSPASSEVEIGTVRVGNGIAVSVADGGKGINEQELERISALAKGTAPATVSDLGDPPRIGYPVIGRIAQRYGLHITVDRESRLSGLRVTVTIPTDLLAENDGLDSAGTPITAQAPPLVPQGPPPVPEPEPVLEPEPFVRDAPPEVRDGPPPAHHVAEQGDEQAREREDERTAAERTIGERAAGTREFDDPGGGSGAEEQADQPPLRTRHGLPVRSRQAGAAADLPAQCPPRSAPAVDPAEAGARMGAWQRAARPTRATGAAGADGPESGDESGDESGR